MRALHPRVRDWFERAFPAPTEAQAKAVPRILAGEDVLLSSPTGTGKTLAAFLGVLSRLHEASDAGTLGEGVLCVYVSPLKALVHDVARNLQRPIGEMGSAGIRVGIRTGETPRSERDKHARAPPHILVTTPESLALVLAAPRMRDAMRRVRWVIVDEVHSLAGTKRGAHLALALERLDEAAATRPTRIGMSATVRPLDAAARFLVGEGRACRTEEVRPKGPCRIAVELLEGKPHELEEALHARLQALLAEARTTLVFTNTRASAESLVLGMRSRAGEDLVETDDASLIAPHHGSMSKEERQLVEARLARGELQAVVASSSLELGIHVDDADHVVLLGSPKSAARALQRVGRSGHGVDREARGTLLVSDADELAEAIAVAQLAHDREVEPLDERAQGALDVLAQHLVALVLDAPRSVDDALALTRRAAPYFALARDDLVAVLRHLRDDARLLLFDEAAGTFQARSGRARWALATNAGTIPRAGLVRVLEGKRFVGEVEEAFAESLDEGDVFQLGGMTWRVASLAPRALFVASARGADPTVPAWRSEGLAMSPLLARATRQVLATKSVKVILSNGISVSPLSEQRLSEFLELQALHAGLPRDGELAWETFVDDMGKRALVLHTLLGRRANEALARALAPRVPSISRAITAEMGIALLAPRSAVQFGPRVVRALFDAPLAPDLLRHLHEHEAFQRRFRHVAQRGLLLHRSEGGLRRRQMDAEAALDRLLETHPEHPLVREATREVLEETWDVPTAEALRGDILARRVKLHQLTPRQEASPFAACILHARASGVADAGRAGGLREAFERCREAIAVAAPSARL